MVSEDLTLRVMVFPVRVLTKICIPSRRRREGFDEYLHTATQTENQVEGGLFLNAVVAQVVVTTTFAIS